MPERFSSTTKQAINAALNKRVELDTVAVEKILLELGFAVVNALAVTVPKAPGELRDELKAIQKSTDGVLDAISSVSVQAVATLHDIAVFEIGQDLLPGFDDGNFGSELVSLRKITERINLAATTSAERTVPRGRQPNFRARHLAHHVASVLSLNGVEPTKTKDGAFFVILEALFQQYLPGQGPTAHERHALFALDHPLEESWLCLE